MTDTRPSALRQQAHRRLRPIRRHVLLHRRRWAALLLALAALTAASAVQTPPPATSTVVVAAADLAGGSVLDRRDLAERDVPADLAPAYASRRLEPLIGRRLAVGVRAGEPLAAHRLAGSEQRRAAPGLTTVPVRIADGASLLRPGDVIDLVAADQQGEARTIARGLPVISAAAEASDDGFASLDQGGSAGGALVLVGVPAAYVPDVVGASSAGFLLFTFAP